MSNITPGALRAASVIAFAESDDTQWIAGVIDGETGLPEMLAALEKIAAIEGEMDRVATRLVAGIAKKALAKAQPEGRR